MGEIDHLAIAARTLSEGVALVESLLGVPLEPGGKHPLMGTHNQLLSLGPDAYLEVIAIDPDAPAPAHPRWFALDDFRGPPALQAWIVRVEDLDAALHLAPDGTGAATDLARGDLRWRMAIPADGRLPFGGQSPALIAWQGAAHPAARLPDRGIRLSSLHLAHPDPAALRTATRTLCADPRIQVTQAPHPVMSAVFETQNGRKTFP
ncbi:VOC family protein [Pararhodobacter sp.]|uniref:VOC family protein n=1 Tax=Pararhodobacter sp. TaxID=2127056 RepID=UPI002AFFA06D|nr:VOC family protein [Pararhodobacter sp.]